MQVNRSYGNFKQSKNYSKSNVFFLIQFMHALKLILLMSNLKIML